MEEDSITTYLYSSNNTNNGREETYGTQQVFRQLPATNPSLSHFKYPWFTQPEWQLHNITYSQIVQIPLHKICYFV